MWICRQCGTAYRPSDLSAERDLDGYYFRCKVCDCRNELVDVRRKDDEDADVGLRQPPA